MISSVLCGLLLAGPATLKVRVDGDGYLRFAREGRVVYATSATLTVSDEKLVGPEGATLVPVVRVPKGASDLSLDLEGNITCRTGTGTGTLGRVVLALFQKGAALGQEGVYYVATERPTLGNPGEGANGVIRCDSPSNKQNPPTSNPGTSKAPIKTPPETHLARSGAEVIVAATSEVSGDQILLGEIAEIRAEPKLKQQLEAVSVGETPALGVSRGILQGHIVVRLRMAGIKPDGIAISVPTGATVSRRCQKIDQAKFVEIAKAAAKEKLGVDVPLTCKEHVADFCAPQGELELSAESTQKTTNGVTVVVAVRVDGKRVNSRIVNLTADADAQGVKAGDTVKILIRSGGATFELKGKVRSSAWVGQQVTIVTDTGSTHTGTVVSSGVVEVKL